MAPEAVTRKRNMRQVIAASARVAQPEPSPPACLVMIHGSDLGRRWMLDTPTTVIGRGEKCEIALDMDHMSRRHCQIVRSAPDVHFIEDLRSTNGTFVNSEEIAASRQLRSGDLIHVGDAIFKYLNGDRVESLFHEEIYRISIVDSLTQVYNRRYLMEYLAREVSRCQRHGRPLCLMMIDIDHFKQVNDQYGHIAGDHVLREVATTAQARVRKSECIARIGGEEFALALPDVAIEKAVVFARKLRALVEAREIAFDGKHIRVTISVGVAQMAAEDQELEAFMIAADRKLYEAKNGGRNRVAI